MVNAPTLFPEVPESSQTSLDFCIYYRKPDGWITYAQGHAQELSKKLRQGFTPLSKYGSFQPGQKSRDVRDVPFSAFREGWRVGFQKDRDGFAREFPVDQIIAYGWHLSPPYREVTFPQIEGVDIPAFECPECVRPPLPSAAALRTHLQVGHEYSRVDLREYGAEVGIDFTTARSGASQIAELEQKRIAALTAAETVVDNEFACDVPACGWAPSVAVNDKNKSLAAHKRFKHERQRIADPVAEAVEV